MIDLRDGSAPAETLIAGLGLQPHPEGGHYRETWRDAQVDGSRGVGTAILFLLAEGERSHWHRVDAAELWVWQAGASLMLQIERDAHRLGPELRAGDKQQVLVPRHRWQAAHSLGRWSLCTCVVTPAFMFEGFELASPGWEP